MPPVHKAGASQFRKDVEFAETKESDEYELEASGIVMVPDKADLQNDFATEATIREFAEQFGDFEAADQAGGGIMHAVWPDGWMELERNEVLDEAEEIGGRTVDAGAWVQRWGITTADLATLIDEDVLEGYSIGAIQVDWGGPYAQDEVDIDTSEVPDGEMVWELTDGLIREVSAVDIPAVPDAEILEAKAFEKRLAEHVGNQQAFIDEAMERGHSEDDAHQLWNVLNDAMEADGAAEPGKQSGFAAAGKAFFKELLGSDDGSASEAPDRTTAKEGRTLSTANRDSLMASIDANLDVLEDAGVDHGMTRFTDQDSVNFDLTEHSARTWAGDTGDDDEDDEEDEQTATAGDTADPNTDMSDDTTDDGGDGDKSLAEQNAEQISALSENVKELTDQLSDGEPEKDAEPDDEPETSQAERNAEKLSEIEERLDTIVEQSGSSTQVDAAAAGDETEEDSGLAGLGKALS